MSIFSFAGWRWHAALVLTVFMATLARAASHELPPLNDPPTSARRLSYIQVLGRAVESVGEFLQLSGTCDRNATRN